MAGSREGVARLRCWCGVVTGLLSQTAVHLGKNSRKWPDLGEVDCILGKAGGVIGPMGGSLCLMCPGYCGECLRPDWRFGMYGQRKYSMELRERATRMALEARADPERRRGAIKRIGGQLGVNPEALRTWVRAVEQGGRNERGEISDQEARIRALEAENRELRRANEILKAASAFFGAELDRLGR